MKHFAAHNRAAFHEVTAMIYSRALRIEQCASVYEQEHGVERRDVVVLVGPMARTTPNKYKGTPVIVEAMPRDVVVDELRRDKPGLVYRFERPPEPPALTVLGWTRAGYLHVVTFDGLPVVETGEALSDV